MQLFLQTELAEYKSQLLTHRSYSGERNKHRKFFIRHERKKSLLLMLQKSFVCRPEIGPKQGPSLLKNFGGTDLIV